MKLTALTQSAGKIHSMLPLQGDENAYALAARLALKKAGFNPDMKLRTANVHVDVPELEYLQNDVKLANKTTLLSLVAKHLGMLGGKASAESKAIFKERSRQMVLDTGTNVPFPVPV